MIISLKLCACICKDIFVKPCHDKGFNVQRLKYNFLICFISFSTLINTLNSSSTLMNIVNFLSGSMNKSTHRKNIGNMTVKWQESFN